MTERDVPSFPVVGIGASAGGVEAFTVLLEHLPADSGMAFVLIQHLNPTTPSLLCDVLAKKTPMPVSQAEDGMRLEPNRVYVNPPSADIAIVDDHLTLTPREGGRKPHLPIDSFFRSLAAARGGHAIGVVLSGTASDGTEGLRAIKAADGITFAQDPGSARFGGMPHSAVGAGVVDSCLPIPELAAELVRLSKHPYVAVPAAPAPSDDNILGELFAIVRAATGVDFSEYKTPTFQRRLARRMAVRRVEKQEDYLALLRSDPAEARALYEDALIHVTSFFRDPEVFESLTELAFPEILQRKADGVPIRVWVAGCSTGEEVYSLAIALVEFLGESPRPLPIQIFGSDVSESAIEKARSGVFSDSALRDVSDERRRRHFTKIENGYRVNKMIRDLCVFVRHDLARDPPFSKLDLVSCRNVLIYFDQELQKRVIATFHYSLNQPGFLLLGRSESISGFGALFSPVGKTHKVFMRSSAPSVLRFAPRSEVHPAPRSAALRGTPAGPTPRVADMGRHVDRLLLARYAPPGVLINEKMEVLEFRGQTGAYLQPAPGEPQSNLLRMARGPALVLALRAAIAQAGKDMAPVRKEGVEIDSGGSARAADVVVLPVFGTSGPGQRLYVVLFEEGSRLEAASRSKAKRPPVKAAERLEQHRRSETLEHELAATQEYLQTLIEEHARATDDLSAANEELISGNEELQSMNEELETAKEELQSANEELTTVNDELHSRNQELSMVNSDLVNVLGTVDVAIVFLDMDRRIRRFTPRARDVLNVLPSDVGRPLDDIKPNIEVADLDQQIAEVIDTVSMKESQVRDRAGRWYRMQIRPYKTIDNRIDGATLSLIDIDALKPQADRADPGHPSG